MEEEEDEEAEAEEEEDEGKVQVGAVPRVPGWYIFLFFMGTLYNIFSLNSVFSGIQPAGVRHLGSSKLVAAWAWKLVIALNQLFIVVDLWKCYLLMDLELLSNVYSKPLMDSFQIVLWWDYSFAFYGNFHCILPHRG